MLYKSAKKIPDESREKLINTLAVLDGFLHKTKWFAGNDITIADFAILGTITTVKVSSQLPLIAVNMTHTEKP